MNTSWILFVFVIICSDHHQVLGDEDDGCQFTKSLKVKMQMKHLDLPASNKSGLGGLCVYWKISTSDLYIIEVQTPEIHLSPNDPCREARLKLSDDESELIIDFSRQQESLKFITEDSDLMIYYRPGLCHRKDFRLFFRSFSESRWLDDSENDDDGDDDADDGDDDESSGARTTSIVGAVIGSMLAIALIGCAIFLITKCTRRNRTRGLPVGGDSVTVHFWSKDRGYMQAAEMVPSSSISDPHVLDSHYRVSSQKPAPSGQHSRIPQDTDAHIYNNTGPSFVSLVTPPAPPPYSGHEYNNSSLQPQAKSITPNPDPGEEPPPSYADAMEKK